MPSTDALERAGQRAAYRPVPAPPSIDSLTAEVGRRRTKRRRAVGGGVAALAAVVAIPFGVATLNDSQPDVVTLATDDGSAPAEAAAVGAQVGPDTSTTVAPTTTTLAPNADDARRGPLFLPEFGEDGTFDLELDLGEGSFSLEVTNGEDAADRAAAAGEAAEESRVIDDLTVWLDDQGDRTTASALIDETTFIEVTGPTDKIERVLDLVTQFSEGSFGFFGHEDFELPENFFDSEGFMFDPEQFFNGEEFGDFPLDLENLFDALIEDLESSTID